jgi:hypothetical protein
MKGNGLARDLSTKEASTMQRILLAAIIVLIALSTSAAQDPTKVDPRHYKV